MRGVLAFLPVIFVCGFVAAPAFSSLIKNQPRIVHKAPGFQIRYMQRKMAEVPKKTLVLSSDDADWLRRTFASECPFSVIHASHVLVVGYIKDVFRERKSTSLLLVFRGEAEKIGVTLQFPTEKELERALQEGEQALTIITIYAAGPCAPAYLVEFFKTVATGQIKRSLFARFVRALLVVGGVWFALNKAKASVDQKLRAADRNQKTSALNVDSGVAACGITPLHAYRKPPELAIMRDVVVVAVVPNVSDRVAHLEVERAVAVAHIEQEKPSVTPEQAPDARTPDRAARGARRTQPVGGGAGVKVPKSLAPEEIFTGLTPAQREAFDVCGCSKTIRLNVQKKGDWCAVLVSRSSVGDGEENTRFLQKLLDHVASCGVDESGLSSFYGSLDGALKFDAAACLVNKKRDVGCCVRFGRKWRSDVVSTAGNFTASAFHAFAATGYKAMNFFNSKVSPGTAAKFGVEIGSNVCMAAAAHLFDVHDRKDCLVVDWLLSPDSTDYNNAIKAATGLTGRDVTGFYEFEACRVQHVVFGSYGLWRMIHPEELAEQALNACSAGEGFAEHLCSVAAACLVRKNWADYTSPLSYRTDFPASISTPSALIIDIRKFLGAIV